MAQTAQHHGARIGEVARHGGFDVPDGPLLQDVVQVATVGHRHRGDPTDALGFGPGPRAPNAGERDRRGRGRPGSGQFDGGTRVGVGRDADDVEIVRGTTRWS